jgi:catalase
MKPFTHTSAAALAMLALSGTLAASTSSPEAMPQAASDHRTPLDMVNALHAAFGEHHARAVHTKGVILEGSFTPAKDAQKITREPIFTGGALPIIARFSLFAGVPDLPDNSDGASPAGFAVKIKEPNGSEFDIESNQHNGFIVATSEEFFVFLHALAASGAGAPHPTQVEQFLGKHPEATRFLETRTYPASYATATYFGINSIKFTNASGKSAFVRYRYVPRAGEHYLNPDERKAQTSSYLQDEVVQRVAKEAIVYDWYAQIAEAGDKIEDPSIAWPESRKLVKLGTFTLNRLPSDAAAEKTLLFLPGQPHPGVEAADPMLILRNTAYPISLGQRQ